MRSLLFAFVAAGVLLTATPALAHEEIEPATITISAPHFMTLIVANEEDADLTAVTLTAPEGVTFGHGTRQPAGWTGQLGETVIEWTGGTVAHATFEEFGFEAEPIDQPGTFIFAATLGFSNGETESVEIAVEAIAPGGAPTTTTPATTATTSTTAASTSTETTASSTTSSETTDSDDDSDSDTVAYAAGGVGLLALILSIVALVAARRGRGGPAGTPAAGPAPAGPGQDW